MSESKKKIYVIGHNTPDTDSVVSATVYARYLKKQGMNASALIAGKPNTETKYVFSFIEEKLPRVRKSLKNESVFLVDHNEMEQSLAEAKNVYGVIDHHRISGLRTDQPILFRVEPLGSTATLIYKMFKEQGVEIDKKDAALLLSGIISDTLNLTSTTTTEEDRSALEHLSDIAAIDTEDLAEKMFEAKSDLSGKSMRDIILGDAKEYDFGGRRVCIGVVEAISLSFFDNNKNLLLSTLYEIKKEKGFDFFFFGAIDISNNEARIYSSGEDEREAAEKAFSKEEVGDFIFLPGVVSRKKQIVPPLSEIITKS